MLRDVPIRKSLNLNAPTWYVDRMMAGTGASGASVGNHSVIQVYNDAVQGVRLSMWDFVINLSAAGWVTLSVVAGPPVGSLGVAQPMNPESAQKNGLVYTSVAPTFFSSVNYQVYVPANGYQWAHDWPVADWPANYSLQFFVQSINTGITFSGLWLVEPPPGKAA